MKKINILIIEDETILALYIANCLQRAGYEIPDIVTNSIDALNIMSKKNIDIIISDINIKGDIDGIDVCKTIQNIYNTSVIYLTAYKDEQTLQRASQTDFSGYLLKPFREDELLVLLQLSITKLKSLTENRFVYLNKEYNYDEVSKKVFFHNHEIDLTFKEHQLFFLLISHKNSLVSFDMIEDSLWNNEPVSNATRRQLIFRLRNKLSDLNIENIKSLGIKLSI